VFSNQTQKEIFRMALTQQEIDQVTREIEDFKAKSMQYAASSPFLSAHYDRLYTASKRSLRTFDRAKRSVADKEYRERRKQARRGSHSAAPSSAKSKSA
jgi:hypothetical protein